ncbi:hypothetical protein SDC9_65567 [bioreactor metagenome]|uniref:Uncharacterized protein n=1 Tax=bioreactor metagenome TaxID=1076179 RepID=A0A644XSU5_9ZZZZ
MLKRVSAVIQRVGSAGDHVRAISRLRILRAGYRNFLAGFRVEQIADDRRRAQVERGEARVVQIRFCVGVRVPFDRAACTLFERGKRRGTGKNHSAVRRDSRLTGKHGFCPVERF